MIESISFKPLSELPETGVPYMLKLPAIAGKTFEFKPGINLIVGRNACGKTSLLEVIRKMTFTDEKLFSFFGYQGDAFKAHDTADELFPYVTMIGDYTKAIFNARTANEVTQATWEEDGMTIQQTLYGHRRSKSQMQNDAFKLALVSLIHSTDEKYNGGRVNDAKDFVANVKNKLDPKKVNSLYGEKYKVIQDYYDKNHKDGKDYTLLVDELDSGADANTIIDIMTILTGNAPLKFDIQIIAPVHNFILINRAVRMIEQGAQGIHIIEMTDGYLKEVDFAVNHAPYITLPLPK